MQVVKPHDVVVDIGTGTGVLAALAVRAGAKHVFAIERSSNMAALAGSFFAANGMSDRVTVIEGDARFVELPRRADVLVTETIGNDPLDEGVLSIASDAVKRHLVEGARIIPGRVRVFATPIEVPESVVERHQFTAGLCAHWKELYSLDFLGYAAACAEANNALYYGLRETREWLRLARPSLVAEVDLTSFAGQVPDHASVFEVESSGILNGALIYFELDLGGGVVHSTHPDQADRNNSWASKVWLAGKGVKAQVGSKWLLEYRCQHGSISDFSFRAHED
jgi:SAM-dependent methyltransferase